MEKQRFIDFIYKTTAEIQEKEGLTEKQSARIAQHIIEKVREKYASKRVYIHKSDRNNRKRVKELSKKGQPMTEIAKITGLSESWISRMLRS